LHHGLNEAALRKDREMTDEQYKFPCEDLAHASYKWGIEYSNDEDGDEVTHVEWFTTEEERNQLLKG
jgi:hypothetical protein